VRPTVRERAALLKAEIKAEEESSRKETVALAEQVCRSILGNCNGWLGIGDCNILTVNWQVATAREELLSLVGSDSGQHEQGVNYAAADEQGRVAGASERSVDACSDDEETLQSSGCSKSDSV
jgi:hypothetical protein